MSACPKVGPMFNEGIWKESQKRAWEGRDSPRTGERDEAHDTAFLLGTPSLQAAGCSMQPILCLPRACVVLCILHLTMAMGHLLGEFVDREAREVAPSVRQEVQILLSERRARWNVYGPPSPDGEETANFYEAWPDIARCLSIRPGLAKYKAVAKI